jgi:hypothetical protein
MRKSVKALFSVALAAATFGLPAPVAAAADSPVAVQVEGGYSGVVPQGGWAPVQVNVTNHGPDTKATLRLSVASSQNGYSGGGILKGIPAPLPAIGSPAPGGGWFGFTGPGSPSGGPPVTQQIDVVLPAGTAKHFTAYLPAYQGTWKAEVVGTSGKSLAAAETQVTQASSSLSIAVVSDDTRALNQIGSIQDLYQTVQGAPQLIHLAPGALPETAAALSSFGLVAITNATTDSLTAGQRRALDDYVAQGGSVLVTGGNAWRTTQAGLPADLVAMSASAVQSVPGLAGLASALGKPAVAGNVDVATGTRRAGVTALGDGQTPILVDAPLGRGRILYLAVDPTAEPLASWSGTLPLLRQAVVRATGGSGALNGGPLPLAGSTARGVQAQGASLFQALSNIPSLDLPSALLIALALIVFIVLVGPVNYFLLRRIHRPDLAWGTIPLLVVLSAGSIYGIGLKTRGTDVLADRVRLIYAEPGSNRAYVNAATGVFAPHAGTHAVSTVNGSLVTSLSGGTQFLNGGGFAIPQPFSNASQATGSLTIKDGNPPAVRMTWPDADSIQAFGEEYAETQPGALEAHLTIANGRLTGTVVNRTGTTITDAVVLSGTAFSTFGTIRPGTSVPVDIPLPSAGSVNRLMGPTSTLPQQVYLHAPASCGPNAPCNLPGVNFPSGRPTATQRQAQRRSDVLNGVLGSDALEVSRPMFVGWSTAPSSPVRVDGHRAQLNELDAYILQLDPSPRGESESSLPTGAVAGRAVDVTGSPSLVSPGGGRGAALPPGASVTYEFPLGAPAWQRLSLTVTVPASAPVLNGNATTAVYNFRTSAWDPLPLSISHPTDVPAPADHVSPDGLLRVRAETSGNPAELGIVDVAGQRAPTA